MARSKMDTMAARQAKGTVLNPINIDVMDGQGIMQIEDVGTENIYMIKDGLHYYHKPSCNMGYRVGMWDFNSKQAVMV
jgi:hypothetical protein